MKKEITSGRWKAERSGEVFTRFEESRNSKPCLFSIETTNNCNMKCKMCPRTTEMTREIRNMDMDVFRRVSVQVSPHDESDFAGWVRFVESELGIHPDERGENPFYFLISSKSITMHGFGEPLFDPQLKERTEIFTGKNIPTYFSCNPSNINLNRIENLFRSGLKYIKFSLDSLNDEEMKAIRGRQADYSGAYRKILEVLDLKERAGYPTTIVICMIKMNSSQDREAEKFIRTWENKDVYSYIKSLDNQWYYSGQESEKAESHYTSQYCEFPWTSLSVMVDGTVVPCTQDFNCEMPMGNVMDSPLEEIWNSEIYRRFRMMHISGEFPENYRCKGRCDIKTVADYLQ